MTTDVILGLSVIAALVTTLGNLAATFLKDFVFARQIESWRASRTCRSSWEKCKVPMFASALELMRRVEDIYTKFPADYLKRSVLKKPRAYFAVNDASDPHYLRYKLLSSLYRFASFWAWVEIYRRETSSLSDAAAGERAVLEKKLAAIRVSLADGQIQTAEDWREWTDRLIFREELRAVGEMMINPDSKGPPVIGYAAFCALMEEVRFENWAGILLNFFLTDSSGPKDFRRERFRRLIVDLHGLCMHLDPAKMPAECKGWDHEYGGQRDSLPANTDRKPPFLKPYQPSLIRGAGTIMVIFFTMMSFKAADDAAKATKSVTRASIVFDTSKPSALLSESEKKERQYQTMINSLSERLSDMHHDMEKRNIVGAVASSPWLLFLGVFGAATIALSYFIEGHMKRTEAAP